MLSHLKNRWRGYVARMSRFRIGDELAGAEKAILAALMAAELESRPVYLRDLHLLASLDQPRVLRCVGTLEQQRKLRVEKMVLDPLAGRVTLR